MADVIRPDRDEEALAAFFAARAPEPPPRPELVAAILADAAAVSAARPKRPAGRWRLPRLGDLLAPLGGMPAVAALVVCAMLGFTAGLTGRTDTLVADFWTTAASDTANDTATDDDPVVAFFDLGPEE